MGALIEKKYIRGKIINIIYNIYFLLFISLGSHAPTCPPWLRRIIMLHEDVDPNFYKDSGAITHMTTDIGKNFSTKTYNKSEAIYVGNGQNLPITPTGDTHLNTSNGQLILNDVLVILMLTYLISVSQFSSWTNISKVCNSCQLGKHYKLPFHLSNNISNTPFQKDSLRFMGAIPNFFDSKF